MIFRKSFGNLGNFELFLEEDLLRSAALIVTMAENKTSDGEWNERFEKIVDNTLQIVWFILMIVTAIWVIKMIYFK